MKVLAITFVIIYIYMIMDIVYRLYITHY